MTKMLFVFVFLFSQIAFSGDNQNGLARLASTGANNTVPGNGTALQKFKAWCSTNPGACVMATLTAAQIVENAMSKSKSDNIAGITQCTGSFCDYGNGTDGSGTYNNGDGFNFRDPSTTTLPGLTPTDQGTFNNAVNTLTDLKSKGYTYDPKTGSVNTPNGGSVDAASLGSVDGLKAIGLTDADIKKLNDLNSKLLKNKGGATPAVGYDDGGGAGMRKSKHSGEDDLNPSAMMAAMLQQGRGGDRGVAGLQKRLGQDAIGVSQDNIFQMIHRRYEAQKPSLLP